MQVQELKAISEKKKSGRGIQMQPLKFKYWKYIYLYINVHNIYFVII
jgi:hypothetical protein